MKIDEFIKNFKKDRLAVICNTVEECDTIYEFMIGRVPGFNYTKSVVRNHCEKIFEDEKSIAIFYGHGSISKTYDYHAYEQAGYKVIGFKDLFRNDYEVELL